MQRTPVMLGWLLFVLLCASLAYWLLQWFAPAPRAVAAPPEAVRPLPSVAAVAPLFGGRPQDAGGVSLQLRGIVLAGRASAALIAAEGKPARALALNAQVLPGMIVKQIHARSVLLSQGGMERELTLPPFAAQETASMAAQAGVVPEPPPTQAQPAPPQPQLQPQAGSSSSGGASLPAGANRAGRGASGGASGGAPPAPSPSNAPSTPGAAPAAR